MWTQPGFLESLRSRAWWNAVSLRIVRVPTSEAFSASNQARSHDMCKATRTGWLFFDKMALKFAQICKLSLRTVFWKDVIGHLLNLIRSTGQRIHSDAKQGLKCFTIYKRCERIFYIELIEKMLYFYLHPVRIVCSCERAGIFSLLCLSGHAVLPCTHALGRRGRIWNFWAWLSASGLLPICA